tara:strand:+ start:920 stop:1603 length:684 start_codon:yes stop_codon:yes gene_type:complete
VAYGSSNNRKVTNEENLERHLKLDNPLARDMKPVKIGEDVTGLQLADNNVKVENNLEVGGNIDADGNITTTSTITSSNGVSQGKFIYDIQRCGYYSSSANASYLPLNGYIIEKTATSGNNEFIAFVAPFNGTLEKIMWRSEIAQDGNFRNHIYESEDGTEVPGTSIGRWDSTHDIADDIVITFDFTTGATSGDNILTKGRIYAISIDPPTAPQDTNATVVFKWDITT